jgi:DNA-binding transcriptional ArsR family regulator
LGEYTTKSEPPHTSRRLIVAAKPKFTRIPKTTELIAAGVPAEAIGTYCCLADYANNKTGLCWPKMETLAATLNRSVRTVQRHLHMLRELGLIEFVTRRRNKGRFSSYLYRICFLATTGHGGQVGSSQSNKRRTKQLRIPPKSPSKNVTEGYEWLFGEELPPEQQLEHDRTVQKQREEEAKRRRDGFEWFFK